MINVVSRLIMVCSCWSINGSNYVETSSCRYIESIKEKRSNEIVVERVDRKGTKGSESKVIVIEGNNNRVVIVERE